MRINFRTWRVLVLGVVLLSIGSVTSAAAKKRTPHRKAVAAKRGKKGGRPKARPANGTAPVVLGLSTLDTSHDGHIDSLSVRLSQPPETRGLAAAFRVAGYQVTRAQAHGNEVQLDVVAHGAYDTGARPAVTIAGLEGIDGKRSAQAVMTPTDGAPPVLVSGSTADRAGTGKIDAINLLFSEPVIVGSGAVQVQGYQVQGYRDYPDGELTVLLAPSAQSDTAGVPTVTLNGADLRDGAGNDGPSGPISLTSGAAPVMIGAQDEGFWLTGERLVTIWSAPVHVAGPGAPTSFSMTTPQGRLIPGTALAGGEAPNEVAVDLPLGAETPSRISYTAGGATVVDGNGHAAAASPLPIAVTQGQPQFAGTLSNPFNQAQMLPFGDRSFYIQPWRSYVDTFPATRMLNAVGINFNVSGSDVLQVTSGADLLHDAGFTHARIGVPWNAMDYNNPGQISSYNLQTLTNQLHQLAVNGIRPLILLQSNQGIPCPVQSVTLNVTTPAAAGATTVQLDTASAALVRPGLTGLYQYGMDAGVIITSVNAGGVATLSQPLQTAVATGPQNAVDLAFQPFFPEYNADGTPNATNQATMAGWLQYVGGVTQTVKTLLGDDHFDVEVWNELSFGSAFLSAGNYYNPAPQGSGNITQELLQATVNFVRNRSKALPDVGIGDGFTDQSPFIGGASEVPGVTAIDKHPYKGATLFPAGVAYSGNLPIDAAGAVDGTQVNGAWHDTFVPSFTSLFPEYFLTSQQTETVTRDLAPFVSDIYGGVHGRFAHPPGAPAPQMWVTEVNLDPDGVNSTLTSPTGAQSSMSAADVSHFEAKAILRYLAAWVGKGVSQIDFYAAANANDMNLIAPSFWTAAQTAGGYPGLWAGGPTIVGIRRLLDTMQSAQNLSQVSPLNLQSISDYQGASQFAGNGTAAYPALYNRNMVGFFPFQVTAHKWAIPTYVMTLNMATLYNPGASATDVTRQDMPPEVFRFTIGGVNAATASASATDPLTGASVPVKITGRSANTISVEIPLTDYPRVLTLTDG